MRNILIIIIIIFQAFLIYGQQDLIVEGDASITGDLDVRNITMNGFEGSLFKLDRLLGSNDLRFGVNEAPSDIFMILTPTERLGLRNNGPTFTLDVKHGLGEPDSSTPNNGFNLENEGSNNNNWTMYVSNTDGSLDLYANGIKEVEFLAGDGLSTVSDRRMKMNIDHLKDGMLDKIMLLSPRRYDYRHAPNGQTSIGLIAQEVEPHFPEVVNHRHNDTGKEAYTINYTELIPVLIKGMQEQQEMINKQSSEIEQLKSELDRVRKMLTRER